jgi:putative glutamine amidotransferase
LAAPLIGIPTSKRGEPPPSTRLGQDRSYIEAVQAAGGIPVLLPIDQDPQRSQELLHRLDGLLLPGGGDVDPQYYGQQPRTTLRSVDAERDAFELALSRMALERGIPLLAICRGLQVLNVALGGTLHQHLEAFPGTPLSHDNPLDSPARHPVEVSPDSLLAKLLGAGSHRVNSHHHQAIDRLAQGLRVTARAPDGVIEAVEVQRHPFALAVQWHPERMEGMHALFARLTQVAMQ